LLKQKYNNEEHRTESGIWAITDSTFRPEVHANRISTVAMVPDSLFYAPHNTPYGAESMPWNTEMELKVGDEVWHTFMPLDSIHTIEVEDEPGVLYRLLRYDDIYLAKRHKHPQDKIDEAIFFGKEHKVEDFKIIMLNGYCLCEEILDEKISALDVIDPEVNKKIGRIAVIGKANKSYYKRAGDVDLDGNAEVKVGDIIVKRREDHHIRLEESLHAKFPLGEKKMYFIIQRKDMYAKITKDADRKV